MENKKRVKNAMSSILLTTFVFFILWLMGQFNLLGLEGALDPKEPLTYFYFFSFICADLIRELLIRKN